MRVNPILRTDSYKPSHWKQYPPNTAYVRSYLEARGGPYSHILAFFALPILIEEYLMDKVTPHDVNEAEDVLNGHVGPGVFNRDGWDHIVNDHGGYLPLRIRGVREGTFVPVGQALLSFENTCPRCAHTTNYAETAFYPWYTATVASLSNDCRRRIHQALRKTGTPESIDFKLHDFGYRGTTDSFIAWQAMLGGLAHLVNFKGTDTMPALIAARTYYGEPMAGFSIPAAEHSTITSWGRDQEVAAYRNMLRQFPTGLVAVVSDSYDLWHAIDHLWGVVLKDEVMGRQGCLVIRPDSGDPSSTMAKALELAWSRFGGHYNQKGFRVLDNHVRFIWGDGVDPVGMQEVLDVCANHGFSADNFGFGMGGGLLQKVNRDTCRFAIKCSQIQLTDGTVRDVFKDPVTGRTTYSKRSKAGNLSLFKTSDGEWVTMDRIKASDIGRYQDQFVTHYDFSNVLAWSSEPFGAIRARARSQEEAVWAKHYDYAEV